MKNTLYKFYLSIDEEERYEISPVYKGDFSLDYEMESGQYFHRAKLSGKIDIIGDDYDWIMAQPFDSLYHLYITISHDNGGLYTDYWHGTFVRTDCEVNVDDKKITVQPQVRDRYTKLLDGIEREYDIIKDLSMERSSVVSEKRGYWQLYKPLSDQCANIADGQAVMEDVYEEKRENDIWVSGNPYKVSCAQKAVYCTLSKAQDQQGRYPAVDIDGTYVGYLIPSQGYSLPAEEYEVYLRSIDTDYTVYVKGEYVNESGNVFWQLSCYLLGDENQVLYSGIWQTSYEWSPRIVDQLQAIEQFMVGRIDVDLSTASFYGRYINASSLASVSVHGVSVENYDIPLSDIVTRPANYARVFPCGTNIYSETYIFVSGRYTTNTSEQTKWGEKNGEYYLPPSDDAAYLPIYQRDWPARVSFWVRPFESYLIDGVAVKYNIPDMFSLNAVISALLAKIDSGITFNESTDYSEFLYSTTNPISGIVQRLYITPKSNVLVSEYSMAAQKGTITLKTVFDMLCKVFRCYWFVDENNRLRIEHIKWWLQGKSYTDNAWQIGIDLTKMQNTRNGKMWSFGKNVYTFEKQDMPERITFKWMDDVSDIFDGHPIILESPLVEQDRKDEQSISQFTTDVGYMLFNGSDISKDGFALIGTNTSDVIPQYTYGSAYFLPIPVNTKEHNGGNFADGQTVLSIPTIPVITHNYNRFYKIKASVNCIHGWITIDDSQAMREGTYDVMIWHRNIAAPFDFIFHADLGYPEGTAYITVYTQDIRSLYDTSVKILNYYLSMQYLLPTYWAYGLPVSEASFNGQPAVTTTLVARSKTQSAKVPIGAASDPDVEKLIKTGIGIGQVSKLSVNLSSRIGIATLKHDLQ